jgi:hypothetical protein
MRWPPRCGTGICHAPAFIYNAVIPALVLNLIMGQIG